ncbi:uncharacterized protein LOC116349182 [Contarinia nasturtii]|uniref:uncharacterized protein LOC116349182 n=1 Tax=Contarinia nasturtii TaxID=265458 RepID=UPI0012D40D01|nr:uncharacterized protein LOC116349182 [Contarinia nasturtii]
MKLLPNLLVFGFIQICFAASLVKRQADSLTSSNIHLLRNELVKIPNADTKAIDNFVKTLEVFEKNSTEQQFDGMVKLLALAMDVDYLKLNQTLTEVDKSEENEAGDNNELISGESNSSEEYMTEDQLKKLETALSSQFTQSQTEIAMKFFHAMDKDASSEESESAIVILFMTPIYRAFNLTKTI